MIYDFDDDEEANVLDGSILAPAAAEDLSAMADGNNNNDDDDNCIIITVKKNNNPIDDISEPT
jgi:hypothetical protein